MGPVPLRFYPLVHSQADVLLIQAKAIALLKDGKTVMEWENDGTKSVKSFVTPVPEVIDACATYLRQVDPTTYGRRIRRTNISYL